MPSRSWRAAIASKRLVTLPSLLRRAPPASPTPVAQPPPTHPLVENLQEASRRRDAAALEEGFAGVLEAPGLGSYELLVAGAALKEDGFPAHSERLLRHLLVREPDYAPGLYELGVTQRWTGQRHAACANFARAVEYAPSEFRFRFAYAEMLHAVGLHERAEGEIAGLAPTTPEQRSRFEVLENYALYLRDHPQGQAHSIIDEVKRTYSWVSAPDIAQRIEAAVSARRGFALIRLGDGEGAFARVDDDDEARHEVLYRWMRENWVRFLFGPAFDPVGSGYEALTQSMMRTVAEADVLGVPYPNWIHHEYAIASTRGVPCVLNIHRSLLAHPPEVKPLLCDQIVHLQLHGAGLLEPILRKAGRLTVISCLTGLGDLLKARMGLEEVEFMPVPREYTAPHLRGRDGDHVDGEAFPAVFDDMLRRLSQPHEGRVFVIAAGTLGKFYAATIKRHGGVALDLGSLVDGWMRLPSRAGYDDNLAL